ncbi:DUF3850 domain-containing protein [Enterococcus plantarum]|uniref:DUF3850 domain-containing protein n=1 Tax=Enterococcus plantarum TaxID=1077675 RepID=UPI001A8EBFAC|nr:DUF3850 domain-containing protein [Enterococcus plantarum]MBO0465939.1 DUF3850 domain-containing protein [Enterococcus plantarum]
MTRKPNQIMVHSLKSGLNYFEDEETGHKPYTIRVDDREFESGDFLFIQEYDFDESYTGKYFLALITSVFGREDHEKEYVKAGTVILGIKLVNELPKELNGVC